MSEIVYKFVDYHDDPSDREGIEEKRKFISVKYDVPLGEVCVEEGFGSCAFAIGLPEHKWDEYAISPLRRRFYRWFNKLLGRK